MPQQSGRRRLLTFWLVAASVVLACGMTTPPAAVPAFDPTKAALQLQGTALALQLTQGAASSPQQVPSESASVPAATEAAPAQALPSATPDLDARLKSAEILVYENTDERGIGMWIQDALDGMGLEYTQTGSFSGHFMEYLNSGAKYDLIIVGAEDKDKISGDFWDVISTRLTRDKAALIAEVWWLDREANGPINKILGPCGVRFRIDWPVAESIYWWEPTHPVFNEPNLVLPLLHYNRFWANQAGDKLMMGSGGDAVMLAGASSQPSSGEGLLATCFEGRVIIQTFSDHDFRQAEIIPLWQNYIYYTLKNHFAALP